MSQEIAGGHAGLRVFFLTMYITIPRLAGRAKGPGDDPGTYRYYNRHVRIGCRREYLELIYQKNQPQERVVRDYIAGMTDQYAIDRFAEIFIPRGLVASR